MAKTDSLATLSLTLGILGFAALSLLAAIPAIICGHVSLSRIKKSDNQLKGVVMARAGMTLGYSHIAIIVVFVIYMWHF